MSEINTNKERNAVRYINKLASRLKRRLESDNVYEDLSGTQGLALRYILSVDHTLCQRDLEIEYSVRPASMSELIYALEKKGYIIRKENPDNRRMKYIIPTQKALSKKDELMNGIVDITEEAINGLTQEQYDTLLDTLEILLKNTEKY